MRQGFPPRFGHPSTSGFPFLFGGTFIEAVIGNSERVKKKQFPFLFGGTFIEADCTAREAGCVLVFPFLFGGTFIEA